MLGLVPMEEGRGREGGRGEMGGGEGKGGVGEKRGRWIIGPRVSDAVPEISAISAKFIGEQMDQACFRGARELKRRHSSEELEERGR